MSNDLVLFKYFFTVFRQTFDKKKEIMKNQKQISTIILTTICILLFNTNMSSQKKWKEYLVTGSSVFVSGMLDGTIETISYHYETGFKPRFPNINDKFWNPALSWKNKYKDGNPALGPKFMGSTTLFVSTTDAYHLLRTTKRTIDGGTLAYYINKTCSEKKSNRKKWKSIAKDFVILTAIRCAGFHLTYTYIFKQHPNY